MTVTQITINKNIICNFSSCRDTFLFVKNWLSWYLYCRLWSL